jgi:hypothetical protein
METINLPLNEYNALREEINLLRDTQFLEKVNKLIELLYQEKYGLYLGDYTEDLTEDTISTSWDEKESKWDGI